MMHPKALRDYVQEMVCSIYGLPPAVLQFGVGLEAASQNATMVQLEKQAWETGILDVQNALASQIGRQLLPAFGLDVATYRLGFDTSAIEVLQRDRKAGSGNVGPVGARRHRATVPGTRGAGAAVRCVAMRCAICLSRLSRCRAA